MLVPVGGAQLDLIMSVVESSNTVLLIPWLNRASKVETGSIWVASRLFYSTDLMNCFVGRYWAANQHLPNSMQGHRLEAQFRTCSIPARATSNDVAPELKYRCGSCLRTKPCCGSHLTTGREEGEDSGSCYHSILLLS